MDQPAQLPHLTDQGAARMVDVSAKQETVRAATATGRVLLSAEAVAALREQTLPKGDALAVARIAAIQGAKKTADIVPLCHPLSLSGVRVDLEVTDDGVDIAATIQTTDRTGVEMEALTAVSAAALSVIDMIKAVDRAGVITDIGLQSKTGGRRGDWRRAAAP
jgi:cyclic pyranopterin phosphate synthase